MNAEDARRLNVRTGDTIDVDFDSSRYRLTVALILDLPTGVAAMSVGLPRMEWAALPGWGTLRRAEPAS